MMTVWLLSEFEFKHFVTLHYLSKASIHFPIELFSYLKVSPKPYAFKRLFSFIYIKHFSAVNFEFDKGWKKKKQGCQFTLPIWCQKEVTVAVAWNKRFRWTLQPFHDYTRCDRAFRETSIKPWKMLQAESYAHDKMLFSHTVCKV